MTDTSTDDDAREGLDLRPNGTVRVVLDGTDYRLRRPRAREFRSLRAAFKEITAEMDAAGEADAQWAMAVDADLVERRKTDPDARITIEQRREDRDRAAAFGQHAEQLMFGWWAQTFDTLGVDGRTPVLTPPAPVDGEPADAAVDEFDPFIDLPIWMGSTDSATVLFDHWRTVPSLSGGR